MALSFEKSLTPDELTKLREQVRGYSKTNPALTLAYLALDWVVIIGIIALVHHFFSLLAYAVGVCLIATRQHALAVISHEGVHSRIFRSQRANIVVANLFCTYPMLVHVEMFRHNHLLHHQNTNNENDPDLQLLAGHPDWQFPTSGKRIFWIFARDFLGFGVYENWKRMKRYNTDKKFKAAVAPLLAESKWIRVAFYVVLATTLTVFGGWKLYLAYWIFPLLWIFPAILRLRNMAEHYGLSWKDDLHGTRDVTCGWLEGWLFGPHQIRLHLVHHLYPSIPFYNLPKMRKALMEYPAFRDGRCENSTYVLPKRDSLWRDLTTQTRSA